jgi:hypothetical protein
VADDRLRLLFRPTGDLLERTRACESEVFLQTYGNTEADFAAEYGPYDADSHFIALADRDGDVVGACRLISPSPLGLKTVNDVSRPPWEVDGKRAVRAAGADPDLAWDVATIAVRQRRGLTPLASAALYHGLVLATRANAVRWIVMMLDERARRLLAMAGFVARPIPGTTTAEYLGSGATTPLVGDVAAMIDNQRRTNPDAYRLMSLGAGLDGFEIPPLESWVVTDSNSERPSGVRKGLARSA